MVGVVETHGRARDRGAARRVSKSCRAGASTIRAARSTRWISTRSWRAGRRLVLVDELAHTNAPGSRHPKRYLDVEELLAAGIDVYTTLNIQHVESLNDVVAQITRIRVRETVPDSVLDRADEIEVIDLAPDELIQRLKEGKVYVPHQADRAIRHYFKPGNLTALRELALRRTAAARRRADAALHAGACHQRPVGRGRARAGLRQRASVLPRADPLRQAPRRPAACAVGPRSMSRPRATQRLREAERDRIAEALRLAEQLGGDAITLPGARIADEVVRYATENNITQIVIGKSERSRWFEILHGSVVHELVRRAGNISVHVISRRSRDARPARARSRPKPRAGFEPTALCSPPLASSRSALGVGMALQQFLSVAQHLARLSDRHSDLGGALRPVPVAVRLRRQRARL